MKNPSKYIGSRHLRVGLEMQERSVRVKSIRLIDQPVHQSSVLSRPIAVRIDIADLPVFIESIDDPRVAIGVYHKNEGHSHVVRKTGQTHISIPFVHTDQLKTLRIRLTDTRQFQMGERHYDHLVSLFEKMPPKALVHEITVKDLRAHPHWTAIFGTVDIQQKGGRFEIYIDVSGMFRWRLRRSDGEIVADSGEGYKTRQECETDLQWIRGNAGNVPVVFL